MNTMESEFGVTIEVDLELDVGSPPDASIDPWSVRDDDIMPPLETIWMTREGENEGVVTEATTKLYPPFTEATRRTVFFVAAHLGTVIGGVPIVTWNGVNIPVGPLWLVTDPSWSPTGVPILGLTEGSWFACEGEPENKYRIQKPGQN